MIFMFRLLSENQHLHISVPRIPESTSAYSYPRDLRISEVTIAGKDWKYNCYSAFYANDKAHRPVKSSSSSTDRGSGYTTASDCSGGHSEPAGREAIEWLKANHTRPLRIEELAEKVGMGVSTFHPGLRWMVDSAIS
jgi:hypothetical protein